MSRLGRAHPWGPAERGQATVEAALILRASSCVYQCYTDEDGAHIGECADQRCEIVELVPKFHYFDWA